MAQGCHAGRYLAKRFGGSSGAAAVRDRVLRRSRGRLAEKRATCGVGPRALLLPTFRIVDAPALIAPAAPDRLEPSGMFRLSPIEDLTRRLVEIENARERRVRAAERLGKAEAVRAVLVVRLDALRRELAGEERDVAELERASLSSLIHQLLGTKEERLARERAEMVDAKVRLEAVEVQKLAIEARLAGLRSELMEIGDLEPERDRLVREFVGFLDQHPEAADKLDPNVRQLFDLAGASEEQRLLAPGRIAQRFGSRELYEVNEAIEAARRASEALGVLDRGLAATSGREVGDLQSILVETAAADLALRELAAEAMDVYLLDPSAGDFSGGVLDALSIAHAPPLVLHPQGARREVHAWIALVDRCLDDLHARLRELPGR
jgi:hypothetical protein